MTSCHRSMEHNVALSLRLMLDVRGRGPAGRGHEMILVEGVVEFVALFAVDEGIEHQDHISIICLLR